ncbi:GGDEF domain-containing protein [Butyrivibrio proteoclasticus]|uniref:GGDEF domain-containing protein n=1 Tax=Butyrivibrio proteoclasticus TaxID=43305 RepID=UPI0004798033|nr:GGDEF domain-containing protein [Butyrivibrio proteoclasticus]
MTRRVKIQTAILSFLAVLISATVVYLLATSSFNSIRRHKIIQLEDGWTISYGQKNLDNVSLTDANIGIINKNDVLRMTCTLPDYDIAPATIHFRSILSSVEVYLDNELIYSYGQDIAERGRMLPKVLNMVPLPDDYQGKELTIVLTAHENNAFSGLTPVSLGHYNDIVRSSLESKRLPLFVGIYLCMLGFLLLILSPFLVFNQRHDFSITFSALISLMMGVYIMCYNDLLWYFTDQPNFTTFVEYFSLFTIPAAILGFIISTHQIRSRIVGFDFFIVNVIFAIVTSVLHLTNVVHICYFVPWLHGLAIIEGLIFITILSVKRFISFIKKTDIEARSTSTNILILGLILFLVCAVIDIIKFNMYKFAGSGESGATIDFLTVGALVFIIALLLNCFYHRIESISESSAKQQLEGLAYTDALTEIANRAKCEVTLADLKGAFTIISIDLDYLKYTNDNYGHDAGDRLLSGFASMLKESFTDASLVGRMGGDEFIVILPYIDEERAQRDIDCLSDMMAHENKKDNSIRYSASWGLADSKSKELPPGSNAKSVYLLADKKMYSMKKKHHSQTLGRLYEDLFKS